MANYPIYRLVKGSTLTFTEMDGNLEWLSRTMSASIVTITGSTIITGSLETIGSLTSGENVSASGIFSHAEGKNTIASGSYSHAEGDTTKAIGDYSHAEGDITDAIGWYSHAEGGDTTAIGDYSHTEGNSTTAIGNYSHAEGNQTIARGNYSHAEGESSITSGSYSHAEGKTTIARGTYSHAEGEGSISSGSWTHAEGYYTTAIGRNSHAEGASTQTIGWYSHAEGANAEARGDYSHAEGFFTVALGSGQHVQGQYNISSSDQSAFIIGNGTSTTARRNLVFASGSSFQITGSLQVSGSITGSIFGTSSWAVSASWAPSNTSTNIYTSDGTITENRTVDVNNKSLTFANINNVYYSSSTGTFISLQASSNTAFISMNYYDTGSNLVGGWGYGNSNVISPVYRNKIYFAGVNVPYSIIMNSVETSRNFVNGNVRIQTGGTYTDNGYKLQVAAQNTSSGSLWVSGSSVITGSLTVSEGITGSNALLTGTLTVQTIVAQTITSSTDFVTGSTRFGSLLSNTHQFTGSVSVTGSLLVNNSSLVTGNGSTGQVTYWNGTNSQTGSNNFLWDNTNQRLSITGQNVANTTTLSAICANGTLSLNNASQHYVNVTLATTSSQGSVSNVWSNNSSLTGALVMYSSAEGNNLFGTSRNSAFALLNNSGTKFYIGNFNATDLIFGTTNLERMRLFAGGNFALGGTTDGGQRLQVYGDTLLSGSGATSATNALLVRNSSGAQLFSVRNDGLTTVSGNTTFLGSIAGSNAAPFVISAGNFEVNITSNNPNNGQGSLRTSGAITTTDNQTKNVINVNNAVTSTLASFNTLNGFAFTSAINQTLGIIRGLYINPSVTAITDFRAIEWSNNSGWGLYGAGTANNFLGGSLGIGTTSPSQGLRIGKAPTLASSSTISVNVAIPNTVTTIYRGISTAIGLNSSGFTLPNLSHFEALNDGTFTAGVVTNLYAFRESLGTFNATNVFGFYGNIPNAANRWNLYMNGTAPNYLAGRLAIGTTITSSAVLTVQGNVSASSFTGSLQGTSSWAVSASWAPSTGGVSGTYTPTLAAVYNVASSGSYELQYMRVGNVVTVGGAVELAATAANTWTRLAISLPISSTFDFSYRAGGGGAANATNNTCAILAEAFSGTRVFLDSYPNTTGVLNYFFSFTYLIM